MKGKTLIIYTSQTGFTKKYAEWISEAAGCECVEFKKARKLKLADYDAKLRAEAGLPVDNVLYDRVGMEERAIAAKKAAK